MAGDQHADTVSCTCRCHGTDRLGLVDMGGQFVTSRCGLDLGWPVHPKWRTDSSPVNEGFHATAIANISGAIAGLTPVGG